MAQDPEMAVSMDKTLERKMLAYIDALEKTNGQLVVAPVYAVDAIADDGARLPLASVREYRKRRRADHHPPLLAGSA